MTENELLTYVEESLAKGHSRQSIRNSLRRAGWPKSEIDLTFSSLLNSDEPPIPEFDVGNKPTQRKYFRLQEGEELLLETKPQKGLFWYMFIPSLIPFIVFGLLMFAISGVFLSAFSDITMPGATSFLYILGFISIIFVLFFIVDIAVSIRRYHMRYYWITNKRVIVKKGLIGYSVNSIPLERISDVSISRSFIEGMFGFGSLHIQSLAGQYTMGGRMGAEGNLTAIPNPEKNQELIFRLVKEKRKREHITM